MVFAVVGGDLRSVYLVHRLMEDGHVVRCFGVAGMPDAWEAAGERADSVILPTPVLKGQCLNGTAVTAEALAAALPRDRPVFGGGLSPQLRALCSGVDLRDFLSDEAFCVGNAALTARGAVQLLGERVGGGVLVLGGGRIGRLLGLYLARQRVQVTVAARSGVQRAWCRAMGVTAAELDDLNALLPQTTVLVNTIPARVMSGEQLQLLPQAAVLLELASAPGGFDVPTAEAMGLQVLRGGGLPGRYYPKEAAALMAERIYEEVRV